MIMEIFALCQPIEKSVYVQNQLSSVQVDGIWLYTSNFDSSGRITDTCRGDSGGPLFIERNGQVELVGVLKVGLFYTQDLMFG